MTEVELFGRTFRMPVPPPPGYLLAPICAAVIVVGGFVRPDLGPQIEARFQGSQARVERVVAETDRLDPHWRLADLLAHRKGVPDDRNAALRVRDAVERLPKGWGSPDSAAGRAKAQWLGELADVPLDRPLNEDRVERLRAELAPLTPALDVARGLSTMPEGRNEITPSKIPNETPLTGAQQTRQVATLLALDAYRRIEVEDADGAVESCRALLNAARAVGDEPFLASQLARLANDEVAIQAIERLLSRIHLSEAALAQLQSALIDESETPWLLIALRGERAVYFDLMGKLSSGALTFGDLLAKGRDEEPFIPASWVTPAFYLHNQTLGLERLNRAIQIAKMPAAEQPPLWDRWEAEVRPHADPIQRKANLMADSSIPKMSAAARTEVRVRARLRALVLLTASARYRLAHGRLPEAASDLVPEFLPELPADPFSGEPVHLVHRGTMLTAYSVGADRVDHGGGSLLDMEPPLPGFDVGARMSAPPRGDEAAAEPEPEQL